MGDRVALSIIGVLSLAIVGVVGVLLLAHDPERRFSAEVTALPALNAALNATCAALLSVGWIAIRRRRIGVHRACMLAACVASALFLVSYVVYHARGALVERFGLGRWRRWLVGGAVGRVLDVGCGTGRNLPLFDTGVRVIGLDPARDSLRAARRRAPGVALVQGDAQALPFRPG